MFLLKPGACWQPLCFEWLLSPMCFEAGCVYGLYLIMDHRILSILYTYIYTHTIPTEFWPWWVNSYQCICICINKSSQHTSGGGGWIYRLYIYIGFIPTRFWRWRIHIHIYIAIWYICVRVRLCAWRHACTVKNFDEEATGPYIWMQHIYGDCCPTLGGSSWQNCGLLTEYRVWPYSIRKTGPICWQGATFHRPSSSPALSLKAMASNLRCRKSCCLLRGQQRCEECQEPKDKGWNAHSKCLPIQWKQYNIPGWNSSQGPPNR